MSLIFPINTDIKIKCLAVTLRSTFASQSFQRIEFEQDSQCINQMYLCLKIIRKNVMINIFNGDHKKMGGGGGRTTGAYESTDTIVN